MPLLTCFSITDCKPSATFESISTPLLIGPGCITMAQGLAIFSLSSLRPKHLKYSLSLGSNAELMRSFCKRNIIMTSISLSPSVKLCETLTPKLSTCAGNKVFGAITLTSAAPRIFRAWISERATLECNISPIIAILRFEKSPLI